MVHVVGEKALRSPITVASDPKCCAHSMTRCANPQFEASQVQEAPSAAALLWHPCPGWMWAGLPREMGSLFVSASPGESSPSGGMGLSSALGYVLASPAADSAPPSVPRARAWGFLPLSESLMAKSIWIK